MKETNLDAIMSGAPMHSETQVSDLHQYALMVRPIAGPLLVISQKILEPIEKDMRVIIG